MPLGNSPRRGRELRRFSWRLISVFGLLLSACASVPRSVREVVTDDGVAATNAERFAGFVFLRTIGWVPGADAAALGSTQKVHCASPTATATVSWNSTEIAQLDANDACSWILSGVDYVGQFLPAKQLPLIHYRLYLVPEGQGAQRRSFSWEPLGTLRPLYVAHWYRDRARTQANIVDIYAHESTHLRASMLGMPLADYRDEEMPRLAGACAQLRVAGELHRDRYAARTQPTQQMGLPKPYYRSTKSGWDFAKQMLPLFDQDGLITRDTTNGQQMMNDCKEKLTAFFDQAT